MKDFRGLKKLLKKNDWERVRNRKHGIWRCPCGEHQLVLPSSPSDHRAFKNKIAHLRKMDCPSLRETEILRS